MLKQWLLLLFIKLLITGCFEEKKQQCLRRIYNYSNVNVNFVVSKIDSSSDGITYSGGDSPLLNLFVDTGKVLGRNMVRIGDTIIKTEGTYYFLIKRPHNTYIINVGCEQSKIDSIGY